MPHPLTNLGGIMQDIDGPSNEEFIKSGQSMAEEIIKLVAFLGG